MGLHNPLADGQAQAGPRDVPSPVFAVDAGELPKQVRQPLGGYPSALVRDGDSHVVALPHGGHPDGRRLVRVPGRVGEEVVQHLDDAPAVRHDQRQLRREVDAEVVPAPSTLEPAPGLVHQGRHLRRRGGDRQLARLDARHVEQVADQVAHVVGLLADDAEELEHLGGVQLGRRLRQRGGGALDGGKRGPELVAHHAQELGPQPLHLLQRRHVL